HTHLHLLRPKRSKSLNQLDNCIATLPKSSHRTTRISLFYRLSNFLFLLVNFALAVCQILTQ
ncbi:hypothetical protein CC79DRAFT_1401430, partial [Sarocladium strictum]